MRNVDLRTEAASPTAEDLIDRVCDLFEADLKAGHSPDLEHVLGQVPAESRETLLLELIRVSLEYTGTSPHRGVSSDSTQAGPRSKRPDATQQTTAPGDQLSRAERTSGAPDVEPGPLASVPNIDGYELLGELGRGGMGVVYRARQVSVDRLVALKIIQGGRFESSDSAYRKLLLDRFRTEAKAASRLDHENIATVYDIGEFDGRPYYAMRLVEGTSLGKLVQAGPLPADRVVRYLIPVARAIDRLHSTGVVHRDLKPSNILIDEASDAPVVTDFGLAKLVDAEQNVTLSDEGFGSPPYMAPEQVVHATSVTGAADIYSLGATLYHLLTGRPPFQAAALAEIARQIIFCEPIPLRRLNSSIPRDLETICLKCLEKDEHRRYATARELADDLQRFVDHRPIVARPIGRTGRVWRWCRRNPTWTIFAVTVAALLTAAATTSTFLYIRERLATAVASQALLTSRLNLSNELFDRSRFSQGRNPYESLPWLVACLQLDAGTRCEVATRQRIHSVLSHGPELTRTYFHDSDGVISCGTLNSAGNRVLTGGTDRTARIWSAATGECLHLLRHKSGVRQAAFNHRGDLVATAADDGTVQIWTVASGKPSGPAFLHPGYITFLAFSSDDDFLITASADERVRVWKPRDGSLHASIAVGEAGYPISCIAISPGGALGVSSAGDSEARVWHFETGELKPFKLDHADRINCAEFSPDGGAIITGGADGHARVWDSQSGRLLYECAHSSPVKHACFTADSRSAITSTDDAARIWSIEEVRPAPLMIEHHGLRAVAVDPTNRAILTVGGHAAPMWNPQDGKSLEASLFHGSDITSAQFSQDGTSVITLSADGTARTWNCADRLRKCRIAEIPRVRIVDATADGRWILAWGAAGIGNAFAANQPDVGYSIFKHEETITAACISPDGQRIAAADVHGSVDLWSRETGKKLTQILKGGATVRAIRFAPDGRMIATGDITGNVSLWNASTGEMVNSFVLPGGIQHVEFSPKGGLLLAADSKAAQLLELDPQGSPNPKPIELGGEIRGVRFSPDGKFVAIYGDARRVLIWDIVLATPRLLPTRSQVNDVSFAQVSTELLTVSEDGVAQIWRVIDEAPVHAPMKHDAALITGTFSPDGKCVALCGTDGTARVWHIESGKPVTVRLQHSARIVHAQFVDEQRLLTLTEFGDVSITDTSPTLKGLVELKTISMVRSGHYVNEAGELVPVTPADLARLRRQTKDRPDIDQ